MAKAILLVSLLLGALPAFPQDGAAIRQLLAQQQFDAALKSVDAALKTQPANARLWVMRGAALYGLKRTRESLTAYRKALQIDPKFMGALQATAQIEYSIKDANARGTLDRILALDPASEPAHAMRGVTAFEAHDCATAAQHFDRSVQLVERKKDALLQYGYCLVQLNRAADAAPVFRKALAFDAADSSARLNLALALAAADRPAEAIDALQPLAQAEVPDADVLGLLGELYRANQQPEQAIAAFRRGIAIYPKEERLYIGLAALCSYYSSGDLGLEILEVGLKNIPASARLFAMRGVLYSQMGRREKSLADFQRASDLSPGEQVGSTGMALSLLQEGRIDEAIGETRKQLAGHPNEAGALFMLAQALLRKGAHAGDAEFAEAQSALEKSVGLDAQSDQAHALLGKVYQELGKTAPAIRELETARRLNSANRVALYQLMLAYGTAGREQDAAALQEQLKGMIEKEREQDLQRSRIRLMKVPDAR
jgi:tetratricopeptide (TPR) repeat protein